MSPRLAPAMTTAVAKVFLGHADVTDSYVEPSLDEVRDAIPPGTIAFPARAVTPAVVPPSGSVEISERSVSNSHA
jgi:hypothetical protein